MCITYKMFIAVFQVLQNIGNLSPEMDAKEKYMMHMSSMLPGGVKRVKEFILDLVQIDQSDGVWACMYYIRLINKYRCAYLYLSLAFLISF